MNDQTWQKCRAKTVIAVVMLIALTIVGFFSTDFWTISDSQEFDTLSKSISEIHIDNDDGNNTVSKNELLLDQQEHIQHIRSGSKNRSEQQVSKQKKHIHNSRDKKKSTLTSRSRASKRVCHGENDIYCIHACLICGLLIPENKRVGLIQHHKSGFSITGKIHNQIKYFCNCPEKRMIDTNNLTDHEYEIGKKLFADKTGKSSLNFRYSRNFILHLFSFGKNEVEIGNINASLTSSYKQYKKVSIDTLIKHLNNTSWFHFTRKPFSTILSAFYYHKECPRAEQWDHKPLKSSNAGLPPWHGSNVYKALIDELNAKSLSFNDTLYQMVVNKYSKDNIVAFFHFYNFATSTKPIRFSKHNRENNYSASHRSLLHKDDPPMFNKNDLYYFGDSVKGKIDGHVSSCYMGNYFSHYMYQDSNINDELITNAVTSSTKACKLYENAYKKYKNPNSKEKISYNYNYGLIYETIRYGACEWLKFFTVHTLFEILTKNKEYYKNKYNLSIDIYQFEMSQWQEFDSFAKNIKIILNTLNIVNSKENRKTIDSYLRQHNEYGKLFNSFDLDVFVKQFEQSMTKLFIGDESQAQARKDHATFDKYDKEKEGKQFLNANHNFCILIKNFTLSLYYNWDYFDIC